MTTVDETIHHTRTAEIEEWVARAWMGVRAADAAARDSEADDLGSDDVPRLSLTEVTRSDEHRRMYGEWGAEREVRWEPRGDGADGMARRAAAFVAAFVARNERVQLAIRAPRGGETRRCVVE